MRDPRRVNRKSGSVCILTTFMVSTHFWFPWRIILISRVYPAWDVWWLNVCFLINIFCLLLPFKHSTNWKQIQCSQYGASSKSGNFFKRNWRGRGVFFFLNWTVSDFESAPLGAGNFGRWLLTVEVAILSLFLQMFFNMSSTCVMIIVFRSFMIGSSSTITTLPSAT